MNNIKKRLLIYKKLLIMSLMSSSLALTGCNQNQENVELVNLVDSTAEFNEDEFEYLNIDFENCINNNTNLKADEKIFLLSITEQLVEHEKYMNKFIIEDRLKNLKIDYQGELFKDTYGYSVGGCYDKSTNTIKLPNTIFSEVNKNSFIHEFLHVLQSDSYDFLHELSNECLAREIELKLYEEGILSDLSIDKGYDDYIHNYYILSKLVSKESLIDYQYSCNIEVIKRELLTISTDDNIVDSLINELNNSRIYNKEKNIYETKTLFEQTESNKKIYDLLNKLYVTKYNKEIKEDIDTFIYSFDNNISYILDDDIENFENFLIDNIDEKTKEKNINYFGRNMVGLNRKVIPKSILLSGNDFTCIEFNSPTNIKYEINNEFINKYNEAKNNNFSKRLKRN